MTGLLTTHHDYMQNRDYEVTPKKLSFKKKRDSKEKADPVGVLHFLCNTIRWVRMLSCVSVRKLMGECIPTDIWK